MIIVLIHWLIKNGAEQKFIDTWKKMSIEKNEGLYRETLTEIASEVEDLKFKTFSLESPHYKTYINIGMWRSLADFDRLVGKYIPEAEMVGENKVQYEMNDFEYKIRERIVLKKIADRGVDLPPAEMEY